MGSGKILGGLVFLIIGIVILVIGIVPIPGFETISLTYLALKEYAIIEAAAVSFDLQALIINSGFISINSIILLVGGHYVIAGIKSMRYDKPKTQYYYTETKIGLMITGFIMICLALVITLMIFLGYMDPSFSFLNPVNPALPAELAWISMLLPNLLIPVVLTILIIFFVYWIGSKIMKSGVKKESLIT